MKWPWSKRELDEVEIVVNWPAVSPAQTAQQISQSIQQQINQAKGSAVPKTGIQGVTAAPSFKPIPPAVQQAMATAIGNVGGYVRGQITFSPPERKSMATKPADGNIPGYQFLKMQSGDTAWICDTCGAMVWDPELHDAHHGISSFEGS